LRHYLLYEEKPRNAFLLTKGQENGMGCEDRKITWDMEIDQNSKFLSKSKISKNILLSRLLLLRIERGRKGCKSSMVALSFTNTNISSKAKLN